MREALRAACPRWKEPKADSNRPMTSFDVFAAPACVTRPPHDLFVKKHTIAPFPHLFVPLDAQSSSKQIPATIRLYNSGNGKSLLR